MFHYNHGKIFSRFSHILTQFLITTSEWELDYYHEKVNVKVASQVAKPRKTWDLRRLGNFKEISELLGIVGLVLSQPHKRQQRYKIAKNSLKNIS